MAKKKINYLKPIALELIDDVWQNRVVVLLEDLTGLPHLQYAYVISKKGEKLTETIASGNKITKEHESDAKQFADLAGIVEEYLDNLEHPFPAHVLIEMEDELLFVGSTGEVILVASFDGNAPRGYMSMKLSKRVNHLRKLFRTMLFRTMEIGMYAS